MARIELRQVSKTLSGGASVRMEPRRAFGAEAKGAGASFRIDGLDLEIREGEILAVLGPSGCGKSTLLRLIAGLMPVDGGRILFDGVDMDQVPPAGRKIGMVFQNYALYPNYDSRANVLSYFMFRKKTPELEAEKAEKYRRTAELLGVEIEKLMDRMPKGLSGGEQQRVAIGRCITRDPGLFLLDEPFSNLDQKLREKYRVQLRVLLRQFDITTVYVTHDQVEALILADRIALMNDGRIEQVGTAQEIYEEPRSVFVADFLNFEPELPSINLLDGEFASPPLGAYTIGVRPDKLRLGEIEGMPHVEGVVVDVRPLPLRKARVICARTGGGDLYLKADGEDSGGATVGAKVVLSFERCHLFDKASGLRERSLG
jgi:multiple sugar transport system ATP-binding protein